MRIYLIGMGMGGIKTLTMGAREAIENADVLIGARRMLELAGKDGRPTLCEYRADAIAEYLAEHEEYGTAAVLLSGDVSFYSGAKRLRERLGNRDVTVIPGISTLSYMCARLGIAAEDTEAVSLHGTDKSIICRVRDNRFTFALLSKAGDIKKLCDELLYFGGGDCTVYIGSRLGYDDERIIETKPSDYKGDALDPAAVVIENSAPLSLRGRHLRDEELLRGGVPMTKGHIRALSIAALDVKDGDVVYDIGSGTGSVSAELSLISHEVKVYAIERDADARRLTEENRRRLWADNIITVNGSAPEVLTELPPPDRVFIGGSGGALEEIIKAVLGKNNDAEIVLNAVTLNTVSAVTDIAARLNLAAEITLVSAARSRKAGNNILMQGENPIYIFRLRRENDDV